MSTGNSGASSSATRDESRVVWLALDEGVEHGRAVRVFADRDSAMEWLRMKHEACQRETALTDAYWRKEYADRAASAEDPEMRRYYETQAECPNVRRVSEITVYDSGARFEDGDWDSYRIASYQVEEFRPARADDVVLSRTVN